MTAREFLAQAGVQDTEENRAALTRYLGDEAPTDDMGRRFDFAEFPDADVPEWLDLNDEAGEFREYAETLGL